MNKQQKLTNTLIEFYNKPVAKVSIELFLSIMAVIFFAIFAIRPTLVTMSDLVKELEEKRELDQNLSQKIASLATVQSQYQSSQNQLAVLDEALPSNPEMIKTLKIIEKMASDQQLAINSLQISEIPTNSTETTTQKLKRISYPISVSIEGDYPGIKNFVEAVQNSRRALTTESIVFSLQEKQGTRSLQATITISAHYYVN